MHGIPTQNQLLFPLLETLAENGRMRTRDAIAAVADRMGIAGEARSLKVNYSRERTANLLQRTIRWTRQNAVITGLMPAEERGVWELTELGHKTLKMAKPGIAICVMKTDLGAVLFAEALTAMQYVEDGSTQLWFSSPPYPLVQQREYGGWGADRYVATLLEHCAAAKPKLTADGSLVLNLGDVYNAGSPTLNLYQEELAIELRKIGFHPIGKQSWHSPSKPRTTPYVTKWKERLANGLETFWWFAPSERPKADTRNVPLPYSAKHIATIAKGGEMRGRSAGGAKQSSPGLRYRNDNGGKIPYNLVVASPEGSGSAYVRYCKAAGLPLHPARMPRNLAEFWIKLVTEPGDVVFDGFGGSLTTAQACERLGRRYITAEKCLDYLKGGAFRLREAAGFSSLLGAIRYGDEPDHAALMCGT